jgi:hypothetical protein
MVWVNLSYQLIHGLVFQWLIVGLKKLKAELDIEYSLLETLNG